MKYKNLLTFTKFYLKEEGKKKDYLYDMKMLKLQTGTILNENYEIQSVK